ncbi:hypothetical protein FI667_g7868, partial [Globisporangium splendens]
MAEQPLISHTTNSTIRFATATAAMHTNEDGSVQTATTTAASLTTNTTRRILRTASENTVRASMQFQSQVKMKLHHQLLTAGERRRVYNLKHEFHDVAHQENGAPKSMKVFKGEAKDILHGIFLVLLLRFLLVLAVTLGVIGSIGALLLYFQHPNSTLASYFGYVQ